MIDRECDCGDPQECNICLGIEQEKKNQAFEDKEWFKKYDETKDTFKWFIKATSNWGNMQRARAEDNRTEMLRVMNHVWFILPDHRFNIIENPKGWAEFLALIEE